MSLSSPLPSSSSTFIEHSVLALRRALQNAVILIVTAIPVSYLRKLRHREDE